MYAAVKQRTTSWLAGVTLHVYASSYSKMNADKRVESPIPLLPLSTPDVETEKLIQMKDQEVSEKKKI